MNQQHKIGEIFDGKFELQAVLGAGGLGVVYKARQIDYGRVVALKILHTSQELDEEYIARFKREGQVLSQMSHPNVLTIYSIGFSEANEPFLVMELVEGKSLRQLMLSGRLQPARALKIARDMAKAIAYVHELGVVHRDLKPENVLVSDLPEADTVKIIDFGLALPAVAADGTLTKTGLIIGTCDYMSPEQCIGKRATTASDIYSLGVILYEMLSGSLPFVSDSPVGVMYKQINQTMPLLDSAFPELNKLIQKSTKKKVEERFTDMNLLAAEIEKCLDAVPAEMSAPSATGRSRKLVWGLCLLLVPIFIGTFVMVQIKPRNVISEILSLSAEQARKIVSDEVHADLKSGKSAEALDLWQKYTNTSKYTELNYDERFDLVTSLCTVANEFGNKSFALELGLEKLRLILAEAKRKLRSGEPANQDILASRLDATCQDFLSREMDAKTWLRLQQILSSRVNIPDKGSERERLVYGTYTSASETTSEIIPTFASIPNAWELRAQCILHSPGRMNEVKASGLVYWKTLVAEHAYWKKNYDEMCKQINIAREYAEKYHVTKHSLELNIYLCHCYLHQGEYDKARAALKQANIDSHFGEQSPKRMRYLKQAFEALKIPVQ